MPHGAPEPIAYGMVIVLTIGLIFHWLRRAFRHPTPTEPISGEVKGSFTMFDRVQRVFHWATTLSYIIVVFTGVALYDPFAFEPIAEVLGIPLHRAFPNYILVHVVSSGALGVLLAVHIVWDAGKLKGTRHVLPKRSDFKDTITRAKSLLLGRKEYPRIDKYDSFMKNFHLFLGVAFLALAATGLYQLFFAPWWLIPLEEHFNIEPAWRPTLLHDYFGFLLIALVFGHTYFAILPVNRSIFRAMLKGSIPAEEVAKKYRPHVFLDKPKMRSGSDEGKE